MTKFTIEIDSDDLPDDLFDEDLAACVKQLIDDSVAWMLLRPNKPREIPFSEPLIEFVVFPAPMADVIKKQFSLRDILSNMRDFYVFTDGNSHRMDAELQPVIQETIKILEHEVKMLREIVFVEEKSE